MVGQIDFVVPMVFPQDVQWQRDLHRSAGKPYAVINSRDVRYRSWQIEQLQVQCVRKYMPFVGRIVILLARESQVQPWMLREKNVQVVLHEEFIPKELLPTYNSCTIEMFLHRIPGITPQFLYANDDMIPLSPLEYSDFFRPVQPSLNSQLSTLNSQLSTLTFPASISLTAARHKARTSSIGNVLQVQTLSDRSLGAPLLLFGPKTITPLPRFSLPPPSTCGSAAKKIFSHPAPPSASRRTSTSTSTRGGTLWPTSTLTTLPKCSMLA